MTGFDYRLVTAWRVVGTAADVVAILDGVEQLPTWWPAVYLGAERLTAGDQDGVGGQVQMQTKGWLPYSLRWVSTLRTPMTETGFSLSAHGDLNGTGDWVIRQDGADVDIRFTWVVRPGKPLIRRLNWLLHGVFAANHRWAMARGEESLRLELQRVELHRSGSTELTSAIFPVPPPPGPTFARFVRRRTSSTT